jgi:hypothetical protein
MQHKKRKKMPHKKRKKNFKLKLQKFTCKFHLDTRFELHQKLNKSIIYHQYAFFHCHWCSDVTIYRVNAR